MGHLFPSKLACHNLPFWQHLQAAQAGGPFFVQITWATISLYFNDDPGLQIIWPWLRIFSEYKSTLKIFGRFFSKQEAFLNFIISGLYNKVSGKIFQYYPTVVYWFLTFVVFDKPEIMMISHTFTWVISGKFLPLISLFITHGFLSWLGAIRDEKWYSG